MLMASCDRLPMVKEPKRVLVCIDYFLPSTAFGGPVVSVANMIGQLRNVSFEVLTRDSEFRSGRQYTRGEMGAVEVELGAPIHYLRTDGLLSFRIALFLLQHSHFFDAVYLNSFFSRYFSLLPLVVLRLTGFRGRVVLATRGELSAKALLIKAKRKRSALSLVRRIRLHSRTTFHVATSAEREEVYAVFPERRFAENSVHTAIDLPTRPPTIPSTAPASRSPLRVVVLSRIVPIKNHAFVAQLASHLRLPVHITFAGTMDDRKYWHECHELLRRLPDHISWEVRGHVEPAEREHLLANSHLFVSPTLGESYGHAIAEALAAGCPVLISDQTPWRGLRTAGAGADLPLGDIEEWVEEIERIQLQDDEAYREMRQRARAFFDTHEMHDTARSQYRALF